uniref:E3 ubiquitin-protein ligase TRIM68-like n=1 Tax=Scatophagus argus TaxID=75038 RepID=UPI001ED85BC6|nr:E3 ubiquitin-protein ligase TRIM68-like [Scatophagus argus]XP_046237219.1 E3 ubiquitin-protein ligase TRIM68-like [Scatophagus argus]
MADTLDELRFRCSVCLELYTDPVSTPCGHNFCKLCIERYWDATEVCRCPLCKETFYKKPELRINVSFREVVNLYKNTNAAQVVSGEGREAKAGEVACDVCVGVRLKASKSCLVCLASYCESHLEPHKTAAALSRHKLIEPVKNLEDRMCKRHDKILELFCKKEERFICQICAESDHSRHQVVTAEVMSQQKMIQIKRREREVDLLIQDRKKRIEEISHSQKRTKENAQNEIEASVKVFTAVIESIKKTHEELVEEIEARHEAELKRFEELIRELRQEIDELEKKSVELQQLSHNDDHITLLQAFSQAHTLPSTQNWPSIPINELDFLGYIRTAMINVREFINLEIREQSATDIKKMQKFAEDIAIDPDSAGPWLIVSEDGKEVRQSPKKQKVPTSPARFTENTFAVAKQGLSMGRHYWEVGVKEKSNWLLGVASSTLKRREQISPSPERGLWTVEHRDGGQHFACMEKPLPLELSPPPQRVGVFVDYEEKQISFVNAEAKTHIFTFTKCNFPERVYPVFDPCLSTKKKEVAPLRIMIVEITK